MLQSVLSATVRPEEDCSGGQTEDLQVADMQEKLNNRLKACSEPFPTWETSLPAGKNSP